MTAEPDPVDPDIGTRIEWVAESIEEGATDVANALGYLRGAASLDDVAEAVHGLRVAYVATIVAAYGSDHASLCLDAAEDIIGPAPWRPAPLDVERSA